MDKNTFGGTPASEKLVEVLDRGSSTSKKRVGRMLTNYCAGLAEIKKLDNFQYSMALLWRNNYLSKAQKYDKKFRSFLCNVIHSKFKDLDVVK